MRPSRIGKGDFWPGRPTPSLCTNIPPTGETLTLPDRNSRNVLAPLGRLPNNTCHAFPPSLSLRRPPMHLLCPRCGHLIELIGDVGEVVFCPSCRSGVRIDRGATAGAPLQEPAQAGSASEPGTNRPGAGADTVDDPLRTSPQAPAAPENSGRQGPTGDPAAETRA